MPLLWHLRCQIPAVLVVEGGQLRLLRLSVQENAGAGEGQRDPRGGCMDVVVRNAMADRTKPGGRCVFTGTRIAVPDLAQPRSGHHRPEPTRETGGRSSCATEGLTRLHSLGVGELSCCLNFLACALHTHGQPPHRRRCRRCRRRRRPPARPSPRRRRRRRPPARRPAAAAASHPAHRAAARRGSPRRRRWAGAGGRAGLGARG
jgi:hypothetical protein